MYAQVGDFCISRGAPKVPLSQILRNVVLSPKICIMQGPSSSVQRILYYTDFGTWKKLCYANFASVQKTQLLRKNPPLEHKFFFEES